MLGGVHNLIPTFTFSRGVSDETLSTPRGPFSEGFYLVKHQPKVVFPDFLFHESGCHVTNGKLLSVYLASQVLTLSKQIFRHGNYRHNHDRKVSQTLPTST